MSLPPPARVGQSLNDVDTPALILDLDALDANIAGMQKTADAAGTALRPHAKSHKSAEIALKQMVAGAVGVCCQKVSEAELLASQGVDDILVSNQVVSASKIGRLARLSRQIRLSVCIDDPTNLAEIAAAVRHVGGDLSVLVEVDVGMGRCGVSPGDAAQLCQQIVDTEGVSFGGLQAYQGRVQHIRAFEDRQAAITKAAGKVQQVLDDLARLGMDRPKVTGAGTGSYACEIETGLWDELQCGSYVFMDADYALNQDASGALVSDFQHSLFILSGVLSVAQSGRAVVDAGLKCMSVDSGLPTLPDHPEMTYLGASDEHGTLDTRNSNGPRLGDRIRLIPGHCDPTVNLHDWYVGIRGGIVEAIWPVTARGAFF